MSPIELWAVRKTDPSMVLEWAIENTKTRELSDADAHQAEAYAVLELCASYRGSPLDFGTALHRALDKARTAYLKETRRVIDRF